MGGAYTDQERFSKGTHDILFNMTKNAFESMDISVRNIPYCHDKETFGDVDVVIPATDAMNYEYLTRSVSDKFKMIGHKSSFETHMDTNPYYHTLIVDGYQIDLNYIDHSMSDIFCDFFAYNGLNIILNKILSYSGIKLSLKEGLQINLTYFTSHFFNDDYYYYIPIEKIEMEHLIKMIGLDYQQYKKGFRNFDDIYSWYEQSPYYAPLILKKYNMNSRRRRELRNNEIIRHGYARYTDNDFSNNPTTYYTYDSLISFLDKYYPDDESHRVYMDKKIHDLIIDQETKKFHRETKNFMLDQIKNQYYPRMGRKEFNYKFVRPLYENNIISSTDSMHTIINEIIKRLYD